MKKIVFCDIPMKSNLKPMVYKGTGNANSKYDQPVIYPINAILADTISTQDEIKVVLLRTENATENNHKNSDLFIQELNSINSRIGAKITYEILDSEFKETKNNHGLRLKQMIDKIDDNSQLFADITYGPKPLPMILMCVLSFAEKFLNCDVKSVVYGKANFTGENISNPELYDVTSLYYLNNLTSSMVAKDSKDARKALDEFNLCQARQKVYLASFITLRTITALETKYEAEQIYEMLKIRSFAEPSLFEYLFTKKELPSQKELCEKFNKDEGYISNRIKEFFEKVQNKISIS